MSQSIPENKKISPFLVFFIIHAMQMGIGVLGFQRMIARYAGHDAWISIILAGLIIHILLWMMFKMLKMANGDIISIHTFILGKKIGTFICSLFILYFCFLTVIILRGYIEVVQVWMFPELETFWFALAFLIVVIYIINGGFRTVTGIAFFSVILTAYILLLFALVLPFTNFTNLLPVFDHSVKDILLSSRDVSLSVLGFDTVLFFYPFVKNPEKAQKWAHLAIVYMTFVCLILAIMAFTYFSKEQLEVIIWPTLTMWKIIKLPFVERFEYIGVANWCLVILPNVCITLWCASRLVKRSFSIRQKTSVPVLAFLCLVATSLLATRSQISFLANLTGMIGFYFNLIYVPLLFITFLITKKVKDREKNS